MKTKTKKTVKSVQVAVIKTENLHNSTFPTEAYLHAHGYRDMSDYHRTQWESCH